MVRRSAVASPFVMIALTIIRVGSRHMAAQRRTGTTADGGAHDTARATAHCIAGCSARSPPKCAAYNGARSLATA